MADRLREHRRRVTPQRRAILEAFEGTATEHLSADEVHSRAMASVPEVSRGTVYAALAELTELGLLSAVGSPEPIRYESNVAPHQHFRCQLCMRLYDVDLPIPRVTGLTERGFDVLRTTVLAEGRCADCRDYERGLLDGVNAIESEPLIDDQLLSGLACCRHESVLGPLLLAASADGMVRVAFDNAADAERLGERARGRRGGRAARDHLRRASRGIDAYLAGDRTAPDDPVDWSTLPAGASQSALQATCSIPYGGRLSYDLLATEADAYTRGLTMGVNPMPLLFPCHRVTRGNHVPAAYLGGHERRERLFAVELGRR